MIQIKSKPWFTSDGIHGQILQILRHVMHFKTWIREEYREMCPETILERSEPHVKSPGNQPPGGRKHSLQFSKVTLGSTLKVEWMERAKGGNGGPRSTGNNETGVTETVEDSFPRLPLFCLRSGRSSVSGIILMGSGAGERAFQIQVWGQQWRFASVTMESVV